MFITALRALCSISAVLSQDSALFFLCMPYWKRLAFARGSILGENVGELGQIGGLPC